jgi:pilus assembly protein CpaC
MGFAAESELSIAAGKSMVLDSDQPVYRVAMANPAVAEAVVMSPREIVVNGKSAGETSLLVWEKTGERKQYDVRVEASRLGQEAIRDELRKELAGQNIDVALENGRVFLRGDAQDLVSAERAVAIASALGPVVNLLYVQVPQAEPQILLKVRFANVDRAAISELGVNLFSTGAGNTIGAVTTGQFTPPRFDEIVGANSKLKLTDALNVFLLRPDLSLGATIRALENKRMLDILAEPNLLAMNERPASFLAGGEFPFPTLQGGGAGLGAVTIEFREFGVRISFFPVITPRGTIRLEVTPEVSSLDFSNGLLFQGFTIPAVATRRVQTEVELRSGQSFAIGGLLDQRTTESWSKVPGIGDIPIIGKLFQSRSLIRNNTELLVIVTPELISTVGAAPAEANADVRQLKRIPMEELIRRSSLRAKRESRAGDDAQRSGSLVDALAAAQAGLKRKEQ